ncbi:hypothetical protein AB0K89_18285 [Streptomyces cinnamoneus]|uniref:hypothetical protein n=1 Tax=Streptomyces cinnamoneus TaxID=53446 RepID=UPI00343CD4A6
MVGRRSVAVALSSLVLTGSSLVWAPAAQTHTGAERGVVCTGTNDSHYDPPLTLAPRTVHVRAQARYTCTVAPGRTVPATGSLDVTAPGSACVALTHAGGTEVVHYADGGRSLIVYGGSATTRAAGVLVTRLWGRVTEGRGAGLPARRTVITLPGQLPTDCLTSGLRGNSSPVQLEVHP